MNLAICGLDELKGCIERATHILSIVDPEDVEHLPRMNLPRGQHLILTCHDVDSSREALQREARMPGSRCVAPSQSLVKQALEFGKKLTTKDILLVHCGYGISRSPAIAFALLCQARPKKPESDLLQEVTKIRPESSPNALIVKFADELLHRNGRMMIALKRFNTTWR